MKIVSLIMLIKDGSQPLFHQIYQHFQDLNIVKSVLFPKDAQNVPQVTLISVLLAILSIIILVLVVNIIIFKSLVFYQSTNCAWAGPSNCY